MGHPQISFPKQRPKAMGPSPDTYYVRGILISTKQAEARRTLRGVKICRYCSTIMHLLPLMIVLSFVELTRMIVGVLAILYFKLSEATSGLYIAEAYLLYSSATIWVMVFESVFWEVMGSFSCDLLAK